MDYCLKSGSASSAVSKTFYTPEIITSRYRTAHSSLFSKAPSALNTHQVQQNQPVELLHSAKAFFFFFFFVKCFVILEDCSSLEIEKKSVDLCDCVS